VAVGDGGVVVPPVLLEEEAARLVRGRVRARVREG